MSKNSQIFMYFFVGLFLIFGAKGVYGDSLVAVVNTPVIIKYDNKQIQLVATQNTVEGAIHQSEIDLGGNDITEPPLDTLLNGKKTTINVIRQLPVLISDNNQEQMAFSAYSDPYKILDQLKVEYYPEDKIVSELIVDPVEYNAVGQRVVIKRAPVYKINVDNGVKTVRSWADTVGGVLTDKGISLGKRDIVEPVTESSSNGVLEVTITRVNTADVWEEEAIEYSTTTKNDYSLYVGQSKVTQVGVNGLKKNLVHIVYYNGEEVERSIASSEVISDPVGKFVLKGVKPYDAGMWWDTIVTAGNMYGVDPVKMNSVMDCESHGNPYSGTNYIGLFQYSPNTWAGASSAYPGGNYAGASINNGTAQIYVTAWKVSVQGWGAWPTCAYR